MQILNSLGTDYKSVPAGVSTKFRSKAKNEAADKIDEMAEAAEAAIKTLDDKIRDKLGAEADDFITDLASRPALTNAPRCA